ncbi:MAG: CAP domain-containing protein [Alphaproteobacteria bacterium]
MDDRPVAGRKAVPPGLALPAAIAGGLAHHFERNAARTSSAKITIAPLDVGRAERLLNAIRKRHGSDKVCLLASLQDVAARHSAAMAQRGRLAHDFGAGSSLRDRLANVEPHIMAAENVGAGYSTLESVLKGWMASRGHWRNMADSRLTHFGLAMATNPGSRNRNYWTLIMIRPNLT